MILFTKKLQFDNELIFYKFFEFKSKSKIIEINYIVYNFFPDLFMKGLFGKYK